MDAKLQLSHMMFYYCAVNPYLFILCIISVLNVRDNSDEVKSYATLVRTRTHMMPVTSNVKICFKNREIDDFDIILFQIYSGICLPIMMSV